MAPALIIAGALLFISPKLTHSSKNLCVGASCYLYLMYRLIVNLSRENLENVAKYRKSIHLTKSDKVIFTPKTVPPKAEFPDTPPTVQEG
jgi:hypothetical protein